MLHKILTFVFIFSAITFAGCSGSKKENFQGKSAKEIYLVAEEHVKNKNYTKAVHAFESLVARYPYGEYADKAQLAIIRAYYNNKEAALGLSAAEQFIKMHPRHPQVDEAYFLKGMLNLEEYYSFMYRNLPVDRSLRDDTLAKDALEAFNVVITEFPKSTFKAEAIEKTVLLRKNLANHNLHIAEYYMKRKAFLAAVNRTDYIVSTYPDCLEATKKAYEIMAEAYTKLNISDLASKAQALAAKIVLD